MKHFGVLLLLALLAAAGCKFPKQTSAPVAADGFYVESSRSSTRLVIRVPHPTDGRIYPISIEPFAGFVPVRIDVFDTPEGSHVQISGRATAEWWSSQPIILIADRKPYLELSKLGHAVSGTGAPVGSSATISLVRPTRAEADAVASALRQRFSL